MRLGSLFAGVGGLDMAVKAMFGTTTAWHCEFDKAASKVLAAHWPDVPNLGDVTKVDWDAVELVDIMCGGYPCQPFSAAGQRKGTDDERHMWTHFAEAIRRVRPRYVVLENVAGHRSMGFDSVLGDLAAARYDAQWCSVRASDVGAPHRRERLFILATDADAAGDRRNKGWPESAGQLGRSDAPECGSGPVDLLPTPNAQDGNGGGRYNSEGHQSTLPGTVRELLPTPRKSDGDGGPNPLSREERMDDVETRIIRIGQQWGKYEPAIRRWEALTRPASSPTEPNRNGNPRLAAEFAEWLMGWPDGWVTDPAIGISRNDQLRCIGNGVVTRQAAAAITHLLDIAKEVA